MAMTPPRSALRRGNSRRRATPGRKRENALASSHADVDSDPYEEMLAEATRAPREPSSSGRPLKRRRVDQDAPFRQKPEAEQKLNSEQESENFSETLAPQVVYDDSETSEENDLDWEEVDIEENSEHTAAESSKDDMQTTITNEISDITVDLNQPKNTPSRRISSKKLSASTVEKRKRLDIHKVHLCCLLAHVAIRNSWCNDAVVHNALKPMLSRKIISALNPDVTKSQFQRSTSFVDGLEQSCQIFRIGYTITSRGLKRCAWSGEPMDSHKRNLSSDAEGPISKEDFRHLAKSHQGSQDAGAQLFCALLRSVGVDARLVCSLQPLPFANPAPAPSSNVKDLKSTFDLSDLAASDSLAENSYSDLEGNTSDDHEDARVRRVKRFGGGNRLVDYGKAPPVPVERKKIIESKYPVYWVEAFNAAHQRWLTVDLFATRTVGRPNKLEPPASDSSNNMSYVVAFEDDRTAKDVTRRYVKAYNAKTRRARVEASKGGGRWWKKLMKLLSSPYQADRDQVEDAELAQKEASEPLPRNVQDFKDHPYYALERHLRRNEIIHPKKEVGKISATKASDIAEPIYRRQDVQTVKSADKWYREGREIMESQQPLKYSASNPRWQRRSVSPSLDHYQADDDGNEHGSGLYADFQTQVYQPPPVKLGQVPRNVYGNLDIYVDSMIPAGGVHVRAIEAAAAAKIMGINYAEAVTGFRFKGRRGTAVTFGVVVAEEFSEGIEEVIRGIRYQAAEEQANKERRVALALWKRFLIGLRIQERIAEHDDEGQNNPNSNHSEMTEQVNKEIEKQEQAQEQGGFIPDANQSEIAQPTAKNPQRETGFEGILDQRGYSSTAVSYDETVVIVASPWTRTKATIHSSGRATASDAKRRVVDEQEEESVIPTEQETTNDLFESTSEGGGFNAINETADAAPEPDIQGGGFVVDDATMADIDIEEQETNQPTTTSTKGAPQHEGEKRTGDEDEAMSITDSITWDVGADHGDKDDEDSEDDDRGSLLSHDPEDEEAEPDWL